MALRTNLDWANAFGVPPPAPNPEMEKAMVKLRENTTTTHIDSRRNLTRNLVMLAIALSGLLAITNIIRQDQEQQKAQVISVDKEPK
ncbi:hypothetical protein HZC21_05460 [Candidatus Peregrinibacteria bacterium]|nr:hypothetical protein [Candidatus Peregrinibacteria bacterium]